MGIPDALKYSAGERKPPVGVPDAVKYTARKRKHDTAADSLCNYDIGDRFAE